MTNFIKHLQYLQNIPSKYKNINWFTEIVKVCCFYNDTERAFSFLESTDSFKSNTKFLKIYIEIYIELRDNDAFCIDKWIDCNEIHNNLKLFIYLLMHFKKPSEIYKFSELNLDVMHFDDLYRMTGYKCFLYKLVEESPYVDRKTYEEYAKERGINKKEVLNIFKATNAKWAYALAKKYNWI